MRGGEGRRTERERGGGEGQQVDRGGEGEEGEGEGGAAPEVVRLASIIPGLAPDNVVPSPPSPPSSQPSPPPPSSQPSPHTTQQQQDSLLSLPHLVGMTTTLQHMEVRPIFGGHYLIVGVYSIYYCTLYSIVHYTIILV